MGTVNGFHDLLVGMAKVSIQLVSPASGDTSLLHWPDRSIWVSIQLVSPASGDDLHCTPHTAQRVQRPFARTPKNLSKNKLSPTIKIAETLT